MFVEREGKIKQLLRIVTATFLALGWLLIAPTNANSDDPISIAAQEIQRLNESVSKLGYQNQFISLIDIAENKFTYAKDAEDDRDDAIDAYDLAVFSEATALSEKNAAQTAVDVQTVVVATANTIKQNKQDALDVANINVQTQASGSSSQTNTLNAYLYNCYSYNESPPLGCNTSPTSLGPWAGINFNYGSGGPEGLSEDYQIKWTGYIKTTQNLTPQFRTCGDDGMILKISGLTVINDWYERGGSCGYSNGYYMSSNGWEPIEVWWYENGGGANGRLEWNIGNGWVVVPANVFSITIPQNSPAYEAALAAQVIAQQEYDAANTTYINENNTLSQYQSNLNGKITAYDNAVTAKANALTDKNNTQTTYDQSLVDLNDAIDDAWDYYYEQLDREIQSAIAQAAANAANQPKPEPSPEPTKDVKPEPTEKPKPEPSPEQTKPDDSTPTPKPETTDEEKPEPTPEPEQTPEPLPEPSPQPEDKDPEPTPEPEPTPVEPSPEPSNNDSRDLEELVPEKGTGTAEDLSGVISNLTSKDNKLVTLSSEQIAAVSQTLQALTQETKVEVAKDLGIAANEVVKIAEQMKTNPALAEAFVEFAERAGDAGDTPMPFTLADAVTEVQTEAFLENPLGAVFEVDVKELLSNFSELGMDMTDDQREKAQEVIVPVIIVSQIASAMIGMRR